MHDVDILDQTPGFVMVLRGPEHRVERVNQAHAAVFSSSDWAGRTLAELAEAMDTGIDIGLFRRASDEVRSSGRKVALQGVALDLSGGQGQAHEGGDGQTRRYFNIVHGPLRDQAGQLQGVIVQGFDVTEMQRAQRRDGLMAELADLIRNISDPDDLAYAAAELLGREMNVSRAGYGTVDTRKETIQIERDWNAPGIVTLAGTLRFRDYGSYIEDLKRGETVIVSDAYRDDRTAPTADALKGISAQSFVNMPVTEEGGIVALLYLNHAEARSWTADELALIRQVAERTRTAVERRRVEAQLRESEARLIFLDRLGRESARSVDADEILEVTTRMLGEHLKVSVCAYADMEPDQDHFTIRGDWSAPGAASIRGYYSLTAFGVLAVEKLHAGHPLVLDDTAGQLAPHEAQTFLSIGLAATICMPLVKEGRLTALMAIHDRVPRHWQDHELALLREVTERSWAHIERVRSQMAASETAERLRLATEAASIGTWDFDLLANRLSWDTRCKSLFGLDDDTEVSYEDTFLRGLHPRDRDRTHAAVLAALESATSHFEAEYRTIGIKDGQKRWIAANGAVHVEDGVPVRFIGTVRDITAVKTTERHLKIVNDTGASVAAERDLDTIVQTVTDAGVELSGAGFGAFFYNVLDDRGGSYMLYALSGAAPDAFNRYPMPRATDVFKPTFVGEGVVRSDDILADPRYGRNAPYHGMPKGHLPVRSYLAVPVVSRSGEVLGGLFFGHPETARFGPQHEAALLGIAGHAATAIDNARLFRKVELELSERRRAEAALQALNATLEERVAQEVTERNKAEEQLRQAQKMEAVGQLTGGIAHDFNNMLAVIIGGLNILQRRLAKGDTDIGRFVEGAMDAAQRAANLVQRLLAFSRRQPLAPEPLNANRMIGGMSELLMRTLGETIHLETVLAAGLWQISVDAGQLESAILNLCVNARDAMPAGGRLTIETGNIYIDERYAREASLTAGQFVLIAVTDSGTGMVPEVIAKAFDPFYTTKEVGKGTGLGLSQVYGFVRQSGGTVKIYSEVGVGSTIKIYLPRYYGEAAGEPALKGSDQLVLGKPSEVILVVEDEARVRAVSAEGLRELGYTVIESALPADALRLIEEGQVVSLLFTDVVMPGMSGRELADRIRALRPALPVLYTTGYTRNAIVHNGILEPGTQLLTKPFSIRDLAAKVRAVLDAAG
jgi:PAS domain S-box-containing protein